MAEMTHETVAVRGAAPVTIELTVTHHGPIVLGDPRRGAGRARTQYKLRDWLF